MSHSSEIILIVEREEDDPEAPFDPSAYRIVQVFSAPRPPKKPETPPDATLQEILDMVTEETKGYVLSDSEWALELASCIGVGDMLCLEEDPPKAKTFAVRGHLWSTHYASIDGDDFDEGFEVAEIYEGNLLPSISLPVPDGDTVATYSRVYKDGEDAEEHWWLVPTLHELARDLEPRRMALEDLVDSEFMRSWSWEDQMDLEGFMTHMKRVIGADLSFPVIFSADGSIMDGMHRICKAVIEGLDTILVVQFKEDPKPHNIQPVGLEDD